MSNDLFISAIHVPADSGFSAAATWDYYMLHRLVCTGFTDRRALEAARVLFRFDIEGDHGFLFVQSKTKPDWSRLDPGLKLSVVGPKVLVLPCLELGVPLRFRLLAEPSRRIGAKTSTDRGRRVHLVTEAEQRDWLARKGSESGFRIETCSISIRLWHDNKTQITLPNGKLKPLGAVLFDGLLIVSDPDKLRQAVGNGIGPQKAYGFGLLSIAPLVNISQHVL